MESSIKERRREIKDGLKNFVSGFSLAHRPALAGFEDETNLDISPFVSEWAAKERVDMFADKRSSSPQPSQPAPQPAPQAEPAKSSVEPAQSTVRRDTALIPSGMEIAGSVTAEGDINVIGKVVGDVTTKSNLEISGTVEGNITARNIKLECKLLQGEVNGTESVEIAAGSVVNGNIAAVNLTVSGVVNGNIKVTGEVILTEKAVITGDIAAKQIAISTSAVLNGKVQITPKQ